MDDASGFGGTIAEHGLSFYVEREGRAVIFDTGETGSFLKNARSIGVDVAAAEALVVSHGHYDHAGGVRALYEETAFTGPLWTGPGFFDKKWSLDPEGARYAGLSFDAMYIESVSFGLHPISAPAGKTVFTELIPGVYGVNGFPRVHMVEATNPRFVVDRVTGRLIDDFTDEVCLVVDVDGGLAVVLGCSHPGLMNMLDAVQVAFRKPIRAILGGSHLVEADEIRIGATIEYLRNLNCTLAALGHCTGPAGIAALTSGLAAYRPLSVGAEFAF